jgi:hypothetical protein
MAAAFVQAIGSSTPADGTSAALTTSAAAIVGERIVVCGCSFSDDNVSSVTDAAGNTYAVDVNVVANFVRVYIASAPVTTQLNSSSAITANFSGSESWLGLSAFTLSGIRTSGAVDGTGTFSDSAGPAAWDTSDTATTFADAVIVGACAIREAVDRTLTAGTNFTKVHDLYAGSNMNFASEYRVLSATGTFDASGTWSGTDFLAETAAHVVYMGIAAGGVPNLRVVRSNLRW